MRHSTLAVLAVAWLAGSAWGQTPTIPEKIGFQGRLTDASGNPVTGTVNLTFKLYTAGGAEKWSSGSLGVTLNGGLYSVELGDAALGVLPFDEPYHLGITVESDTEMTPRYRLAASPYALFAKKANDADTLDGLDSLSFAPGSGSGNYIQNQTAVAQPAGFNVSGSAYITGNVRIGTTPPFGKLYVGAAGGDSVGIRVDLGTTSGGHALEAMAFGPFGDNIAVYGRSFSPSGTGIHGIASSDTGTNYGVYGECVSSEGWGLYTPNRLYAGGNVGIGTTTPSALLDVNGNVNINGSLSTLSWNVSGPITLGEVNMDGNILKNPVLGMLMHHASFQGAVKQSSGGTSYVYDGSARLTVNGAGSWCYIRNHDLFNYCNGLNRRGAFVSVRTQFYGLAYQPTGYILAGGTINTALKNGFGFKLDGSSLLGVVRNDYAENTLNTGISVSEFTSYDLIAVVRSSSSVEYFVNGVSRGILTGAPLPAGADGMYECRITTALGEGDSGLLVGYLTVGIPMY